MKTELYPSAGPSALLCRLLTVILLFAAAQLSAHEDQNTHPALTVGAFLFLDQAAPEDAGYFGASDRALVREGSILEDACPNYASHFYDPKTGENLSPLPIGICFFDGFVQQTAPARAADFWEAAVQDYRENRISAAMSKLGHVLHLLQDMSSPAHVHNDIHAKPGGSLCQDGDDFENWGWSDCPEYQFNHIYDYLDATVKENYLLTDQITDQLADGLNNIFKNRPVRSVIGNQNTAYAYVHDLANKVYDFTTFGVRLEDTSSLSWDQGAGELKQMFPSLVEATGGRWWIDNIGYSSGECGGAGPHWWLMAYGCDSSVPSFGTHLDVGNIYIENTGGGGGAPFSIPDSLVPWRYPRDWYRMRYGVGGSNPDENTMLRIYGDVLYTAAVAYGAGLMQAFLDEVIMPQPITATPIVLRGSAARLDGHANAGGESALAWFEWGVDASYGSTTTPASLGSGTEWMEVSAVLEGLELETTYHCRLVSSNRFGVRYGADQVFSTPSYILSDAGSNAWRITDDSSMSGSTLAYVANLTTPQQDAATAEGWRLTTHARLTPTVQGTKSMVVSYTQENQRHLFWLDLDADGDLTIELDGQAARKLTANGVGATDYHTHEVQFANGQVSYRFDGNVIVNDWTGIPATAGFPAGRIFWGSASSAGKGEMNVNSVEFASGGSSLVSYHAGTGGSPVEAPNPILQGWTRNPGTSPVSEGPLSPDSEPFLTGAETLAATELNLEGARLNGRVDPRGKAAAAWFEWGTSTAYGNATPPLALLPGQELVDVTESLTGLAQGATYNYRLVATNIFGVRFGENRSFVMPNYIFSDTLPNAWRITDNSQASGSTVSYSVTLDENQRTEATSKGWRLSTTTAVTTNFDDTKSMIFSYGEGDRRFLFWLYLDNSGDLMVELDGDAPLKLTSGGEGATEYHTHEIEYANGAGTYRFDGALLVSGWDGLPISDRMGRIDWGAGSSGGRGEMKVHRVEFAIGGTNFLASYAAGTAGNPDVAPAPTTQGWTISDTTGTTSGPLSPDTIAFRPVPIVETGTARFVGAKSATLEGSANTLGQPTALWFDWGNSSEYGNQTAIQSGHTGSTAQTAAEVLSGLAVDTTYHYRIVASNAFTVSFGADQTFRTRWFQDTGIDLAAVDVGAVAWGDYDNDGFLDLIITGQSDSSQVTQLYRNLEGTNLVPVASGLPPLNQSAVAWGDFDNDGWLDLLLAGSSDSQGLHSGVYRNSRDGSFAELQLALPGLRWSSVAWADYDNDGDLDFLLCGMEDATTSPISRIYRNEGGTNFVDIDANLPGVYQGSAAWSDFDADGDQDLILTGNSNEQIPISRLYRNDGGGLFAEITVELPGVSASSVAWGDYDHDNDPDLLLTGWDGGSSISHLFRNDQNGVFLNLPDSLPGALASSVAWGDYDNDGDLDLLLAGWSGNYSANIFRNDGPAGFVDASAELAGVNWASAAWADFDNDGDLDALVSGSTESARICHLYRNEVEVPSSRPAPPTSLAGSGVGNQATVSWNPAVDGTLPSATLSYNVVLRSTASGLEIAAPMSDSTSGFRRIPRIGNAGENLSFTFENIIPGTYEFSVQAINSAFAGGPFASWHAFTVSSEPIAIVRADVTPAGEFRIVVTGQPGTACQIHRSLDLLGWSQIGSGTILPSGQLEFIDATGPVPDAFYQVQSPEL